METVQSIDLITTDPAVCTGRPSNTQVAAMAQEEAAYQAMHAELVRSHLGDYVAIYQGQLIAHDVDELRLLKQLDKAYPNKVVLMKQVRTAPQIELRHRSPRLELSVPATATRCDLTAGRLYCPA